jgi:peptide/nickel transport system ATP-binding protein
MSVDVERLTIDINGTTIVQDVDMHIEDGERVGLIGSSGSGKSMIAKSMMGLLPSRARCIGTIRFNDIPVLGASDLAMADLRGRYVSMVFQNPGISLNPVLTVLDQIMLPLKLHYDLAKSEYVDRAMTMLHAVGLNDDMAHKRPHELSGGQQQRVGIATALVTSPRLIIADEPTTALDSIVQRQIVDLLVSLVDEACASMLFITHDFAVLSHATTQCYVLENGSVAEHGNTADVLENPQSQAGIRLVNAARELTLNTGRSDENRTEREPVNIGFSNTHRRNADNTNTDHTETGSANAGAMNPKSRQCMLDHARPYKGEKA